MVRRCTMSNKETSGCSPEDSQHDLPLPEAHFRDLGLGSRTTFYRWEKEGLRVLRVLRVGGRRFIRPSDLEKFMLEKDAKHIAQDEKEVGDE